MFRSIKAANKRIETLLAEADELKLNIKELKSQISENENNVAYKDFVDMRLRAQKAELALEAMVQANKDSSLKSTYAKHEILTQIKDLISKL